MLWIGSARAFQEGGTTDDRWMTTGKTTKHTFEWLQTNMLLFPVLPMSMCHLVDDTRILTRGRHGRLNFGK